MGNIFPTYSNKIISLGFCSISVKNNNKINRIYCVRGDIHKKSIYIDYYKSFLLILHIHIIHDYSYTYQDSELKKERDKQEKEEMERMSIEKN